MNAAHTEWKAAHKRLMGEVAPVCIAVPVAKVHAVVPVAQTITIQTRGGRGFKSDRKYYYDVMFDLTKAAAKSYSIAMNHIFGRARSNAIEHARLVSYWLCYRLTSASLVDIGHFFDRHHATVLRGVERIDTLCAQSAMIDARLTALCHELMWPVKGKADAQGGVVSWRKAKSSAPLGA